MIRTFLVIASVLAIVAGSAEQPRTNAPPATKPATEKSAAQRAWDDLRWLMTAIEAYSTDKDSLYAPAGFKREGGVSDLDQQLDWYYANSFPRTSAAPRVDPWGREYRFLVSDPGRSYAMYSLGADGKPDAATDAFLKRLKKDQVIEEERQKSLPSDDIVVSEALIFAPAEVLRGMQAAREKQHSP